MEVNRLLKNKLYGMFLFSTDISSKNDTRGVAHFLNISLYIDQIPRTAAQAPNFIPTLDWLSTNELFAFVFSKIFD